MSEIDRIYPMLARNNPFEDPFSEPDYVLQVKYDGSRVLAIKHRGRIYLMGRSWINDFSDRFPEIVDNLRAIPATNFILDGELTFFKGKRDVFVTALATPETKQQYSVKLMLFDAIAVDGRDLRNHPLMDRLEILDDLIPPDLKYVDVVKTYTQQRRFEQIFNNVLDSGGEGVVIKEIDSPYVEDSRKHWVKVKKQDTEDCVVCGITTGTGKRKSTFGALILGQYDNDGNMVVVGKCSGFDDETLEMLYDRIMDMPEVDDYLDEPLRGVKRYIAPRIVVEVKYMEKTKYGKLRHPVFIRIRTDKKPKECRVAA